MPNSLDNADYADVLEDIAPGKLIRSDLFAWMIGRLQELDERVGAGGGTLVRVPLLIDQSLGDAAAIINQPTVDLRLGPVLDVDGTTVDPASENGARRTVLMQTPGPGERVAARQVVRLLVTTPVEQEPRPDPAITGFDPEPVRVNEVVTIQGRNFPATWSPSQGDRVTFDEVDGTVQTQTSTSRALDVRVPEGIPNVPDSGDAETSVRVEVTVRDRPPATGTLDVMPASGQNVPSIDAVEPIDGAAVTPGSTAEIQGSNFASRPEENMVIFNNRIERPATALTSAGIEVRVPAAGELGLSSPGGNVSIAVEVGGVPSEPRSVFVAVQ